MSMVKRLAGQSAFFLAGNLFTLVVGLVFQVYLAKYLGASGLGVYGLLESGVGVVTSLLGFGIAQTVMRFIPGHIQNNQISEVRTLIRKGIIYLGISGLGGLLLVWLILPLVKRQWPTLQGYETEMICMSLMIPLGMLTFLSSQVLRGFFDVVHVVIGTTFLQLSLKVIFAVLLFNAGLQILGYVWAVIISTFLSLLWMIFGIRRHLSVYTETPGCVTKILPEWKNYAKVMYSNSLLSFWSAPLDRFLLGIFLGVNAVGVLMVVKMIYILPGVFLQMFLAIVAPMLASAYASDKMEEVNRIYQLCTDWVVRISIPLIVFLIIFAEQILKIFGDNFMSEGVTLLRIMLIAQLINLLCGPIGSVLNMCGLEKKMFRINTFSVIISALIMVGLVPLFGLNGVGISVLFGIAYSNIAAIYEAKNEFYFKWWNQNFIQWMIPLAASVGFSLLVRLNMNGISKIGLAGILVTVYFIFHGSQILIYGLNQDDREIFNSVKNRFKS